MRTHILYWTSVGISIKYSQDNPLPTNHHHPQEITVFDLTECTNTTMRVHDLADITSQSQPKVEIQKVLEVAEVEFLPQVAMLLEAETLVIMTRLPRVTTPTRPLSIHANSSVALVSTAIRQGRQSMING
jgi:hypothetical protein